MVRFVFFFSSRRRHTRCALVTGVQTCALPIWDAPGLEAARKKGNVITSLTDAERARWRAALKPTIDKLLGDLEKQGVTNARAIYTEKIGRASCRERVCQYV